MYPPGQVRHDDDAEAFSKVPTVQLEHANAPSDEKVPGAQVPETAVRKAVAQNDPPGHALQADCWASSW